MKQKTGRNDPCPCGSGMKFKKCCANKPVEQSYSVDNAVDDFLRAVDREEEDFRLYTEELDTFDDLAPSVSFKQFSCLEDAFSSIGLSGVPNRSIPCSSEDEADDLAFNLCLEGHRTGVSCINGVYTVFVFD